MFLAVLQNMKDTKPPRGALTSLPLEKGVSVRRFCEGIPLVTIFGMFGMLADETAIFNSGTGTGPTGVMTLQTHGADKLKDGEKSVRNNALPHVNSFGVDEQVVIRVYDLNLCSGDHRAFSI